MANVVSMHLPRPTIAGRQRAPSMGVAGQGAVRPAAMTPPTAPKTSPNPDVTAAARSKPSTGAQPEVYQ